MNLVQLQDDLRMLPMPVLQSKAKGQDPSVPPWLATAVLNERMNAQQKAGMAQGAAQGQQPSVVEQLEQKAGLMALQAQQQQQAQQQMMQQMAQAPQPAPEQVPQPEAQPEPEQMMARGGLARLPINPRMFNYREGGVIGFSSRGEVPESDEEKEKKQTEADRAAIAQLWNSIKSGSEYAGRAIADIASIVPRGLVGAYDTAVVRPMKAAGVNAAYLSPLLTPKGAAADSPTPFTDIARKRDAAPQAPVQEPSVPPEAGDMGARDRGLASLQKQPPAVVSGRGPSGPAIASPRPAPQVAPQPVQAAPQTAPQAGLPAALPTTDAVTEMAKIQAANPRRAAPTLEEYAKQREEAYARAGIPKDIGAELQEGIGRYEAESERIRKARQKADDLYVLSAQGGLGEIASRSATREAANILADTIRNDKANEMRMAMAAARRAEAMGDVNALRKAQEDYNKAQDEHSKAAMTATATIRGQDVQAQVERERIASTAEINRLDREMRERHYRNPISASTEKEKWVQAYRRAGLSETEAIEKVLEILGEGKAKIAAGRIDAANAKILAEDAMYVNAHKIILDPNSSAEAKAKAKLTIAAKEAALNRAQAGAAPTITPAQAAALAKYGAK